MGGEGITLQEEAVRKSDSKRILVGLSMPWSGGEPLLRSYFGSEGLRGIKYQGKKSALDEPEGQKKTRSKI